MRNFFIVFFILLTSPHLSAQQNSEYGWVLPPHDSLRVLFFFVEIEYDTLKSKEPSPEGHRSWRPGQFPIYADSIFDPFDYTDGAIGKMTWYYDEASLGNFKVMGDYYPKVFTIPYSKILKGGYAAMFSEVLASVDAPFITKNGLTWKDFDFWKDGDGYGTKKEAADSTFDGLDHVMLLIRNYHKLPSGNGMASGSSLGMVNGERMNSYSVFGVKHRFPFNILRHELNHLFLGGNNFHCGGGNSPRFSSYFPSVQGGWAMMGGSSSSYLTASAWDRYWLGWKKEGKKFLINALNEEGEEVDGDIEAGDESHIFILQDFATTGHALRIKLPFIPEGEFQQWIWLENHTTEALNNSPFDVYQYEHFDCIERALPGLAMYYQIDANTKIGGRVYSDVKADYLKPITAGGNFDLQWADEPLLLEPCVNDLAYIPYWYSEKNENPLTGNHSQEKGFSYNDSTKSLTAENMMEPGIMDRRDGTFKRLPLLGQQADVFRLQGNKKLGIGTNPSSANSLSFVNSRKSNKGSTKNNRTIYLNGLSVEILQRFPDGSLKVKVDFSDNLIMENRRWCAPLIVLNDHIKEGADLIVEGQLQLDIGETMTRFDEPVLIDGRIYFTDRTTLRVEDGATMVNNETIAINGESILEINSGGSLDLNKGSKIVISNGSLVFQSGSNLSGRGRIKIGKRGRVACFDEATYSLLRKRTWNKKRVTLSF